MSIRKEIEYKKLSEKELPVFIQMRIRQLREEGATEDLDLVPALQDYYKRHMADGTFVSNKRNVICREASLLFVSQWKDRSVIQHVYGSGLQKNGNCKGTAFKSCKRGKRFWMRNRADHGIRYGRAFVY